MTERWTDEKLIEELLRRDDMVSWQAAKRLEELARFEASVMLALMQGKKERVNADTDNRPAE